MPNNIYWAVNRIGGGTGAADKINVDTETLVDKDGLIIISSTDGFSPHWFDDDNAGAESSPEKIAPDAGGTGDERWILCSATFASLVLKTVALAGVDTDKFLVLDASDTVDYRTGAQVKEDIGIPLVENTALSTWAGSINLLTVGTIGTGVWQGSTIATNYTAAKCTATWPNTYSANQNLNTNNAVQFASVKTGGIYNTGSQLQIAISTDVSLRYAGSEKIRTGAAGIIISGSTTAGGNINVTGSVGATGDVSAGGTCCDIVFDDDYPLLALDDLATYIAKEKALPDMVTSAAKDGKRSLGKATEELTIKVEELTLYMLQLHNRISQLEAI